MIYVALGADISPCQKYRWRLWRRWSEEGDTVLFVGLNPSSADGRRDDPTLRRLVAFAERWGYGALTLVNLYPWRATNPADLWAAAAAGGDVEADPYGLFHVLDAVETARLVVACWGAAPLAQARARRVETVLRDVAGPLYRFRASRSGAPYHPLYLDGDTAPEVWPESEKLKK